MKIILRLLCSIGVTLLVMLSFTLPVGASGPSISPIVYCEQLQVRIAYDGVSSSTIGYDSSYAYAANEKENRTAGTTTGPFAGFAGFLAAKEAPKLLGPGTQFGAKIEGQLAKRGWTKDLVQSTIDNPSRTVPWQDTRHLPGGGTMSEPATAYYSQRGGYVVRNNRTGDIVQVSNRTDPGWKAPWD